MKQFEVWWADLPEPAGRQPVLLLSRNDAYDYLLKFIAVEITSTVRGIESEVLLSDQEGLPRVCVATATVFGWCREARCSNAPGVWRRSGGLR
jgi:mRNA-degrading endonuclease toxin of MazEF toxin-antitoxin module